MVSKQEIDTIFDKPYQKDWHGDDPKLDFPNGTFTGENWNDARINLLRKSLYHLLPNYDRYATVDDVNGEYRIFASYIEDTTHIFITYCADCEWEYGSNSGNDIWYIEWYKSRGKTSRINLNGKPVSLEELRFLIYKLNEIGDV